MTTTKCSYCKIEGQVVFQNPTGKWTCTKCYEKMSSEVEKLMKKDEPVQETITWISVKDKKPEVGREVLVYVDEHRGLANNNYILGAFMAANGLFYEKRHREDDSVLGITHWAEIKGPTCT